MEKCEDAISSFSCSFDPDIESFLKCRAIKYNNISKAKTFFLLSDEALRDGNIVILAYFTITLTILHVPVGISGNKIKCIDGLSSRRKGERITEFPCYLIGQLSKNTNFTKDSISGTTIMDNALSIILMATDYVGGRSVIVDVKPNENLIEYYESNGFEIFNETISADGAGKMIQMMRLII